jgi:hypothetical protein
MTTPKYPPPPPGHLTLTSAKLWRAILSEAQFRLQAHHLAQLEILCESRDRAAQCRTILQKEAPFTRGRPHGALAVEREAQRTALRALAALNLDAELPAEKPGHTLAAGVFR